MPYYIRVNQFTLKEVAHDSWHAANHPDVEYWEKSPFEEDEEESDAPDEEGEEEI